jgi:hypothetical protein
MFERYTEKARRTIFFARYEAIQFGSPYIDTEHILLGMLREDNALISQLLPSADFDSIRKQIASHVPARAKVAASIDLPLTNESKRVLAYAAEEADRMASRYIGNEHLLLGLTREKNFYAAQILQQDLSTLRLSLAKLPMPFSGPKEYRSLDGECLEEMVKIHDQEWSSGYVQAAAKGCARFFWDKQKFKARDIAIRSLDRRISFDPRLAENSPDFELVKGGWKEEVCRICYWEFLESDDPQRGIGYTNGRDWLCCECYERFLAPGTKSQEKPN